MHRRWKGSVGRVALVSPLCVLGEAPPTVQAGPGQYASEDKPSPKNQDSEPEPTEHGPCYQSSRLFASTAPGTYSRKLFARGTDTFRRTLFLRQAIVLSTRAITNARRPGNDLFDHPNRNPGYCRAKSS